jgi:hypothetical protein
VTASAVAVAAALALAALVLHVARFGIILRADSEAPLPEQPTLVAA